VAVSANFTFQTIQNQFDAAGLFPGFRYATDLELSGNNQSGNNPGQVHSLFESAGLGEGFSFSVVGYGLVRDLMGFVGFSGNQAQYGYAYGTVGNSLDPSSPLDGKIEALISQGANFGIAGTAPFGTFGPDPINTTDIGLPVVRGNWLVRSFNAVPEPSSVFLLSVGFSFVLSIAWSRARHMQVARISAVGEGRLNS
jgi:hypothetical protein